MKANLLAIATFCLFQGRPSTIAAQSQEATQLILNVEKLAQFRQILSDMKAGYNILSGGYNTIRDLSEGNFSLHRTFLDGLMEVSPEVRNYRKVAGIIDQQVSLVREYRSALGRFGASDLFRPGELDYIRGVYDRLFGESLKHLDELVMVVTAGKLRMGDDERMAAIDRIFDDMQDKLVFLRSFNRSTSVLALQRERDRKETATLKAMNGIGIR